MNYDIWYRPIDNPKAWKKFTSTNDFWDCIANIAILRSALGDNYLVKYF